MNHHEIDLALSDPGFFVDHDPHPLWRQLRAEDQVHRTEGLVNHRCITGRRVCDAVAAVV